MQLFGHAIPPQIEGRTMSAEYDKTPIHPKITLTIKEAAEYSNIGIHKIESLLRMPNCPFVLFVGTKSLLSARNLKSLSVKS